MQNLLQLYGKYINWIKCEFSWYDSKLLALNIIIRDYSVSNLQVSIESIFIYRYSLFLKSLSE